MRTRSLLLILLTLTANLLAQDSTPPTVVNLQPEAGSSVVELRQVTVTFDEDVQGVDPADLLVNGTPVEEIVVVTPREYRFNFPQPATGGVAIAWAAGHGITDLAVPPNAFGGGMWSYTLDPALALNQVRINEFMADNETGIRDVDGTFQDWIELYNDSTVEVNLEGCFLTDNKARLDQWRFPAMSLPAKSYLLIWASGKNRTNALAPLHTSFRLDPNPPEYLAFVGPQTNVISDFDPTYPQQREDVSYGRDRLDPSMLGFYAGTNSTPGRANAIGGNNADFAPDVQFSRRGGTFINAFDLVLSTTSSNAVIRYVVIQSAAQAAITLTNVPTATNAAYTGPIPIAQTTQIRARAFEPGKLPGTPVSVTFIQIDPLVADFTSDLPLVVLHTFGGAVSGSGDGTAVCQIFDSGVDRSSLRNPPDTDSRIGLNTRGASTAGQAKSNFAVEFWDEFNQDTDRPFLDMPAESDWVLYGINAYDQSMMHNAIFHELGHKIGQPASRYRYVEVFRKITAGPMTTNDYFGVYLALEKPKRNANRLNIEPLRQENTNLPSITGGYLLRIDRIDGNERIFRPPQIGSVATTPADIIIEHPDYTPQTTDPRRLLQINWITSHILNFITNLASANYTDPVTGYASYIDPDDWVDNLIVNIIPFNVDGYRLSGYFHKDRNERLKQGPLWDCDRCLGTGGPPNNDNRPYNPRMWRRPTTGVGTDNGTDFFGVSTVGVSWFRRLFSDPVFWQKFIDRYQALRTNEYSNAEMLAMVDRFHDELKESQARDHARWGSVWAGTPMGFTYPRSGTVTSDGYTYNFGPTNSGFRNGGYFTNEVNFQKQWLLDRLNFMDTNFLAMPVLNVGDSMVTNGTSITVFAAPKPGTLIYYTLDGTDPRLPGGGIAPGALSSAGDLTFTVTDSVRLFARCYNVNHANLTNYPVGGQFNVGNPLINSFWSGPVAATFWTTTPPLRITEIMYHPLAPPPGNTNDQDNYEFLEVKNIGASPLNVNRFRLRGGLDFSFPNEILAPGEQAVIVRHLAAFRERYGSGPRVLGVYTEDNLANDGDRLILEGGVREPILNFEYDDGWYPATDGHGFSLQIVDDGAPTASWGLKASWRPSGMTNGTPSAPDPGPANIPAVFVSEALTHSDPSLGDAIELSNPTNTAVNIGGWYLTDDLGAPKKYRIPDNTMIADNSQLVFYQSNSFGVGPSAFALSSRGDEVYLFSADAAGNLTGWAHGYDFGPQANGVSFGTHVTSLGQDRFIAQTTTTLGLANSGPKVGPILISEINYHPPDFRGLHRLIDNERDEYIELQNTSDTAAPLYDPANPANTWRLRDAVDFTFPVGASVPARGFVLVVSFNPADTATLAAFRQANGVPLDTPIYGPWSGKLDNSKDSVELVRPDLPDPPGTPTAGLIEYILVDKVEYEDTLPWPAGLPDGLGAAIGRIDVAAYGDDPANWRTTPKTPGAPLPTGDIPPMVVTQPVNTSGIEGQSATITLAATGSALGYIWTFNGEVFPAASSNVLTLTGLRLSQAGTYACYVFNSAGAVQSSNVTLTVRQLPRITGHPASRQVRIRPDPNSAPTTNVTFTVSATSVEPPISYQWRFNGAIIPGATGASYTVTDVQLDEEGDYSCAITDGVSTVLSADARLTPWITPVVVQPPVGLPVVEGSDFTHSVEVTGNPVPFAYSWRRGSVVIATNSGNYRSNYITINTTTAGLLLTNNIQASNYVMRLVVFNDANRSPGVLTAFTNVVLADFDRDGIPDVVENSLGLATNNAADAALDLDGDGMNNRAEFVAGTDPTNAASYLRIESGIVPGVASVQVAVISNRTYAVEYTDNLNSTSWNRLSVILARPINRVETIPDPNWTSNRFYRVAVPAP
jgi:hypothetical protein